MQKKPVFSIAVAVFLWAAIQTQTVQARDDIWDLMNPAWWVDQFDDDDDWDAWHHGPDPYVYGGPYGWGYAPYSGYPFPPQPSAMKKQPAPLPLPE